MGSACVSKLHQSPWPNKSRCALQQCQGSRVCGTLLQGGVGVPSGLAESRLEWKGSSRYYLGKTFRCKNRSKQEIRRSSFDKLCFMGLLNVKKVQSSLLL